MSVALTGPAEPGAQLVAGEANAGVLTSVVQTHGGWVGLALVGAKHAQPGSVFGIPNGVPGAGIEVTVADPTYALTTEPLDE